jgi:hypothetical protein
MSGQGAIRRAVYLRYRNKTNSLLPIGENRPSLQGRIPNIEFPDAEVFFPDFWPVRDF